jgi:hypothetical protein
MDKLNYVGESDGEHYFQEIGQDGLIRGLNGYFVAKLVDGERVFENTSWVHSVELENGTVLSRGDKPSLVVALPCDLKNLNETNVLHCEECGQSHDAEEIYNPTFIIGECSVFCRACIKASNVLVKLNNSEDLFKSKDLRGIDLTGFFVVEELFCDSLGMGSSSERALTKAQALERAEEIISNSNTQLYAGITEMGQFQVYVTIFQLNQSKVA